MKYSKNATSIIEAMLVLLIVVSGVVGMYTVFSSSQKLSNSTENKIQAIQIAREGIEAVKNIRDTNWILFGADSKNCWNVLDYNASCVGVESVLSKIKGFSSPLGADRVGYIVFRDTDNRWRLKEAIANSSNFTYTNSWFRSTFKVGYDNNGYYTQSGSISDTTPLFTRMIKINYQYDTNGDGLYTIDKDEKMRVTSLVQWVDSSSDLPHKVEMETILSNWRK